MLKKDKIGEQAFHRLGEDYDSFESLREVQLELIDPPESQPRKKFEKEKLEELKDSIREHGLLQPIVLEKIENGRYRVVSGERRYKAMKELGHEFIQAKILKDLDGKERIQVQVAENLIREDITPLERAFAVLEIFKSSFGWDLEKTLNNLRNYHQKHLGPELTPAVGVILKKIGKSENTLISWLQLLKLPEEIQALLDDPNGAFTPKHAGEILKLKDIKAQISLAKLVEAKQLSTEQIREIVDLEVGSIYHAMNLSRFEDLSPKLKSTLNKGYNFVASLSKIDFPSLNNTDKSEYLKSLEELKNTIDKIISQTNELFLKESKKGGPKK